MPRSNQVYCGADTRGFTHAYIGLPSAELVLSRGEQVCPQCLEIAQAESTEAIFAAMDRT